jgi:N-acetylglutamate synthase-like GNAT family acetyltransferase
MRKANSQDIKSILKILKPYYEKKIMGFNPVIVYYSAANKGNLWVLEKEKQIIGFILIKVLKRTNKLRLIQIAKSQEQKNVGQILINKVIELAKEYNCKSIILEVVDSNIKAINFYKNNNFLEVQQKDNKKEMELIMKGI